MKHATLIVKIILLIIITVISTTNSYSQKTPEKISANFKWDLTDLFPSDDAWRDSLKTLTPKLNEVKKFKGTLTQSESNLLKALQYNTELSKEASKLYIYASMNSDLDMRNMKYSGMEKELQQLFQILELKLHLLSLKF